MQEISFDRLARHLPTLARLSETKTPVNMATFTRLSGRVPELARRAREDLERWGLLKVQIVNDRGFASVMRIRLTPRGQRIAQMAAKMNRALAKR